MANKSAKSAKATEPPIKPGRPPSGRKATRSIFVRISTELGIAVDAFLDSQRPAPKVTTVVEVALEDFLRSKGFWPPANGQPAS